MSKLRKMLVMILVLVLMMPIIVFADTSDLIIDTSKKGSITVFVLQDRNGSVVTSKGTGQIQTLPQGATALENVKMELYLVEDTYIETIIPNGENAIATAVTDSEGKVEFTDLDLGRYLVVPIEYPSNVAVEISNFLVDIPMINATQTAWNYDIVVYPKVQTVYGSAVLNVMDVDGELISGSKFELLKKNDDGTYSVYTNSEYITEIEYVTNYNGQICIMDLPEGEYQFVQKTVPEGYGLNKSPVSFSITETGSVEGNEEDGWVALKDELNLTLINYFTPDAGDGSGFEFNKKIGDSISEGSNIDSTHTWKITSTLPMDIENYTRFLITDQISNKLVLDLNSITVTADGVNLEKDTNYKVAYEDSLLKISFIDTDIAATALMGMSSIEITYTTTFERDNVVMGESVENSASLYWDTVYDEDGDDSGENPMNPVGDDLDKTVEVEMPASVHTGGLKIKKVDEAGNALEGATFKLATSKDNAMSGIFVEIDGEELVRTSGSDGLLYFEGLAYGSSGEANNIASSTYWLVETEAPEGYNLLLGPVEVTVDKDSYNTYNPTTIENKRGIVLPATGGIGTIIFIVIGSVAMITAIIVLVKKYEKQDEENIKKV